MTRSAGGSPGSAPLQPPGPRRERGAEGWKGLGMRRENRRAFGTRHQALGEDAFHRFKPPDGAHTSVLSHSPPRRQLAGEEGGALAAREEGLQEVARGRA